MKKIFFSFFLLSLLIINGCGITGNVTKELSFEERREKVLFELHTGIEKAKEEGRYKCCIEPACTMCYMGNWLWEDGSCYCDDMIAKGEMDKVCPECKKGIESGSCSSTKEEFCNL